MNGAYAGTDNLEVMAEAENYNRYLAAMIRRELPPKQTVLDFGAGTGTFALPLLQLGAELVCVEPDDVLRERLRQAGAKTFPSLAEIDDNSVDFAYTLNVLEHIADDAQAVRDLTSKLKRGGRLLVYVPAFQVLFSTMDRKVGHHRRYRRGRVTALLSSAGLRVQKTAYADSLGFIATLVYRAVGSDTGDINRAALKAYDRWVFPLSRAIDLLAHPFIGKNLVAIASKP